MRITDSGGRHKCFFHVFSPKKRILLLKYTHCFVRGIACIPSDWQFFNDSSLISLKVFFLHKGNQFPTLLVVDSEMLTENGTWKIKVYRIQLVSNSKFPDGWFSNGNVKVESVLYLQRVWSERDMKTWSKVVTNCRA